MSDESDDVAPHPDNKDNMKEEHLSASPPSLHNPSPSSPSKRNTVLGKRNNKLKDEKAKRGVKNSKGKTKKISEAYPPRRTRTSVKKKVAKGLQFEDFPETFQKSVCPVDHKSSESHSEDNAVARRILRRKNAAVKSTTISERDEESDLSRLDNDPNMMQNQNLVSNASPAFDFESSFSYKTASECSLSSHQLVDELFGEETSVPLEPSRLPSLEKFSTSGVGTSLGSRDQHSIANEQLVQVSQLPASVGEDEADVPSVSVVRAGSSGNGDASSPEVEEKTVKMPEFSVAVQSEKSIDIDEELFGF